MREFYVAFRSRSEAARFYEALGDNRIPARVINTPASASVGCGLSVKALVRYLPQALKVLERGRFSTIIGKYYVGESGGSIKF